MAFDLRLLLQLLSFAVLLVLSALQWQRGPSALALTLSLAAALMAVMIWQSCRTQQRQTALVLKALTNQDSTMTLHGQPQLTRLMQQARQQLSLSRQQAEDRAQYLQTLLSQLDVAVLEFSADNQLLQANPAGRRLLSASQYQALQQADFSPEGLALLAQVLANTTSLYHGQLAWSQPGYTDRLAVSIVCTRLQGQLRKLVTLQSINQALLQQELQAYQQMTRVLTHEIANSVTPMASLAQSCLALLPPPGSTVTPEQQQDFAEALTTINRRGQHLSAFIAAFKQLSQPVQATLHRCDLVAIIHNCVALQRAELNRMQIALQLQLPDCVMLWLDEALTEQVLINLLQNALDAMQHSSEKQLTLCLQHTAQQQWQLDICDTGPGISAQAAEQIFIPFFTTKTQGSGIGLSLSRALLQAQDARLDYVPLTSGSCFRIRFAA